MSVAEEKTKCHRYRRRRPEFTPCYKTLLNHLETFIAEREAEGRPLPDYVLEEFESYLRCGVPAHGFLRLKCEGCGEEMIVAFSCKKRGFCPSCCAKRMAEAASHLVENVLPLAPYRQFVVSFPIPLRHWLQTNKKLWSKIHSIVIKQIHSYYREKALASGVDDPTPGSISFTQRAGSAANLNPHAHILCPDGVYTRVGGKARFEKSTMMTDKDAENLISAIASSCMRYLQKLGYLDKEGDVVISPEADDLFRDNEALTLATASSISGKIAFGPAAGQYVTRIGGGFGYAEERPVAKGALCYSVNGFSLHAATRVRRNSRDRLRSLIEYIARGPISNERLEILSDERVKLQLKTPWKDGTTHLLFTPGEFIEKLAALIPPPRSHLVRWAGVFAPNSPYRKEITLNPSAKKGFKLREDGEEPKRKNHTWSKMLAQVFKIDVSSCPSCGGNMAAVCAVTDPGEVKRYLHHINVDYDPPARAPPKRVQGKFDFDQSVVYEEIPVIEVE